MLLISSKQGLRCCLQEQFWQTNWQNTSCGRGQCTAFKSGMAAGLQRLWWAAQSPGRGRSLLVPRRAPDWGQSCFSPLCKVLLWGTKNLLHHYGLRLRGCKPALQQRTGVLDDSTRQPTPTQKWHRTAAWAALGRSLLWRCQRWSLFLAQRCWDHNRCPLCGSPVQDRYSHTGMRRARDHEAHEEAGDL